MTFYGFNIDSEYPFLKYLHIDGPVDFYVDTQEYTNNSHKKIFIQVEPFAIRNNRDYLKQNAEKYDYILCHDASFLKNGISYCPAATWLDPAYYEAVDPSKKQFRISHISGFKDWTMGHKIRKGIYMEQMRLSKFPLECFRSWVQPQLPNINNNPFIPETVAFTTNHSGLSRTAKVILFTEFQFSVVVENTKETNYFSEKLVDCLLMKTIPIYWGCPNISVWFDTTGWICIQANTMDELLLELQEKLSCLTEEYYASYTNVIEENYRRALTHCNMGKNIAAGLLSVPFVHAAF